MRFEASLESTLAAALSSASIDTTTTSGESRRPRIAIAYSGGGDSTALLHAAAALQRRGRIEVHAFHIHHGLADDADRWLAHCADRAHALGVAFDADHIAPSRYGAAASGGLEADARRLRYAALVRLCQRRDCVALLTAHHADDQAETVLVNLARGAGIGGLAATARNRTIDGVLLLRPFLDLPSARLREHLETHDLTAVEDPSNADRRYTRNAIRHEVMPALRRIVPSIATRLAQTAAHAATMQGLLDEIGMEDLGRGEVDDAGRPELDRDLLATLSQARAANALRVWLARRGMRAPSAPALREMLQQLLHAAPDAQIALLHERSTLRLYRGRVSVEAQGASRAGYVALEWRGEPRLAVPEWHGALIFETHPGSGERAFDASALRDGPLALRERRGGERLTVHAEGPSRTLKNLYQEAGIPGWQRARLPLLYLGDRLIYAVGLGPHVAATTALPPNATAVSIDWVAD